MDGSVWTGIELLFVLQDIRHQFPILEDIFLAFSGRFFFQILPVIVMAWFLWYVDKRKGEIIGIGFTAATTVSTVVKALFFQPRPWVLDPGIERVDGAHASGPSFPSSHTIMAASSLIPAAFMSRYRIAAIVLFALAVIVIAGRLFLCVHTPLDIIAGLVVAGVSVYAAKVAVDYGSRGVREFYISWTVHLLIMSILVAASLIASWQNAVIILEYCVMYYGMMIGILLDHRYINYDMRMRDSKYGLLIFVGGILMAGILFMVPYLLSSSIGSLVGGFLVALWISCLFPALMMRYLGTESQ
jgi:undecaprenyl-diphosphatase